MTPETFIEQLKKAANLSPADAAKEVSKWGIIGEGNMESFVSRKGGCEKLASDFPKICSSILSEYHNMRMPSGVSSQLYNFVLYLRSKGYKIEI